MIQWGWNYITRKRGARLIIGEESLAFAKVDDSNDTSHYTPAKNRQSVQV
jgi:NADH dehydrogenase